MDNKMNKKIYKYINKNFVSQKIHLKYLFYLMEYLRVYTFNYQIFCFKLK